MGNPLSALLDWIYPPACISCRVLLPLNKPQRYLCEPCESLFEPITAPICEKCGAPREDANENIKRCPSCLGKTFFFEHNRAAFTYADLIRDLLLDLKFRNKKRTAEGLSLLWAKTITVPPPPDAIFVPMPLHRKKQRERGFNQAETLTLALAEKFSLPLENILERTHDTPPQSGLHPSQRAENVRDIFAIRKNENVAGKNFILTDDIFTTGASLNECAKTLKKAGAAKVFCMTLAITIKKIP